MAAPPACFLHSKQRVGVARCLSASSPGSFYAASTLATTGDSRAHDRADHPQSNLAAHGHFREEPRLVLKTVSGLWVRRGFKSFPPLNEAGSHSEPLPYGVVRSGRPFPVSLLFEPRVILASALPAQLIAPYEPRNATAAGVTSWCTMSNPLNSVVLRRNTL
jgi:hypothetical protein